MKCLRIGDLDPELQRVVTEVPAVDFRDIPAARAATTSGPEPLSANVVVSNASADFDGHTVGVRITGSRRVTSGPLPIVVEMHGGGFALGSAASNDAGNAGLAAALQCVVVAVDYRLAPGSPIPQPFTTVSPRCGGRSMLPTVSAETRGVSACWEPVPGRVWPRVPHWNFVTATVRDWQCRH